MRRLLRLIHLISPLLWVMTYSCPGVAQLNIKNDPHSNENLFDQFTLLARELRSWAEGPEVLDRYENCDMTLNMDEVFGDCEIRTHVMEPFVITIVAARVPFLNVFSTQLGYRIHNEQLIRAEYIPPWKPTEAGICFDDTSHANFQGAVRPPANLWQSDYGLDNWARESARKGDASFWYHVGEQLSMRFQLYRSLDLPRCFQPESLPPRVGATMYFHGRDVDTIRFQSFDRLIGLLRAMSKGHPTYAGPISVAIESNKFAFSFYLILEDRSSQRHHFLTIDESFQYYPGTDFLTETSLEVHFHPYIRSDNIISTYMAKPAGTLSGSRYHKQQR